LVGCSALGGILPASQKKKKKKNKKKKKKNKKEVEEEAVIVVSGYQTSSLVASSLLCDPILVEIVCMCDRRNISCVTTVTYTLNFYQYLNQ
jgi:hypothetical protein